MSNSTNTQELGVSSVPHQAQEEQRKPISFAQYYTPEDTRTSTPRYEWPKDEIEELLVDDFEERFIEHYGLLASSRKPKAGTHGGWVRYGTTKNGSAYSINVLNRCFCCHNDMGKGSMWGFYVEYCQCNKDDFRTQCETIGKYIGYVPDMDDETKRAEQARRIAESKRKRDERRAAEAAEAEALKKASAKKAKSEINQNKNAWRYCLGGWSEALKARGLRQSVLGEYWEGLPDCVGAYPDGFVFYQRTVKYIPSDRNTGRRLKGEDDRIMQVGGDLYLDLSDCKGDRVALVEGEFDALSLWHLKIPTISIKPTHKAFSEVITKLESEGRHGVALYDADEHGERFRADAVKNGAYDAGPLEDIWGAGINDANDFLIDIQKDETTLQSRVERLKNALNAASKPSEQADQTEQTEQQTNQEQAEQTDARDKSLLCSRVCDAPKHVVAADMAAIWARHYRYVAVGKGKELLDLATGHRYGEAQTKEIVGLGWEVIGQNDAGKKKVERLTWQEAVASTMAYDSYCKPRWVYSRPALSLYYENGEQYFNLRPELAELGKAGRDEKDFGARLLRFIIERFKTEKEASFWLNWLLDARINTARKPGTVCHFRAVEGGTGKNTLGLLIPQFFVGTAHCGSQKGFPSKFAIDKPLQTMLFAMFDEVTKDEEKYATLKHLATESPVAVEFKGQTAYMCESSTRISSASNKNADFFEDDNDRRAVMFSLTNRINNNPIMEELKAAIKAEGTQEVANLRAGFMDALASYCTQNPMDVRQAINTDLKKDIRLTSILSNPEVAAALVVLGRTIVNDGRTPSELAAAVSDEIKRPVTARSLGYTLRGLKEFFEKETTGKTENQRWRLTQAGLNLYNDI